MRFWELGNKDVINCKNGHRLGCVGDLEIDVCRFCVTDIYVPTGGKYCGCIGKKSEYRIPVGAVSEWELIVFLSISMKRNVL